MQQIKEVRGFFKRVGTVGHNSTRDIIRLQSFFNGVRQSEHPFRTHIAGCDVRELADFNICHFIEPWHRCRKVSPAHSRNQTALLGVILHRDRAASRKHNDFFQFPISKLGIQRTAKFI